MTHFQHFLAAAVLHCLYLVEIQERLESHWPEFGLFMVLNIVEKFSFRGDVSRELALFH